MKLNLNRRSSRKRRGQSLIESVLVFMVFMATVMGLLDVGQALVVHQMLVERVRGALRWGVVHQWDGSGDAVTNMILYNQSTVPLGIHPDSYLDLEAENVQVDYTPGTVNDPNNERLTVSIVDYQYHFFSPWLSRAMTSARPVSESAAMAYRP